MSRIRTIKPSFWTSAQVMDCRPLTRLFFIGLWNFCDDVGRHPVNEKQLRASSFSSGDDLTLEAVRSMLVELAKTELIDLYEVGGKEYLQVTGWSHQKIDRPQPSKFPEKPFDDHSLPFDDHSENGIDGKERKGREGIGREGISSQEGMLQDSVVAAPPVREPAREPVREANPRPFRVILGAG